MIKKGIAIIISVFFLLCVICIIIARIQSRRRKAAEESADKWRKYSMSLEERIERLRMEADIRDECRKETEKKIDSLHDGDSVANAIAELQNRREGS